MGFRGECLLSHCFSLYTADLCSFPVPGFCLECALGWN